MVSNCMRTIEYRNLAYSIVCLIKMCVIKITDRGGDIDV